MEAALIIAGIILLLIAVGGAVHSAFNNGRNDLLNDMFLKGDIDLKIRNKYKN